MSDLCPIGEDVYWSVEVPYTKLRFFHAARVANPDRFFQGERLLRAPNVICVYATKAEYDAAREENRDVQST